MVNLTIDGKPVEVEAGSTVLQAAEKLGIKIPTLCHHKSLMPYGACRLCLVEIEWPKGSEIQTSCTYPAQEGLVVKTATERVLKTRKIMAELLLARCPGVKRIQEVAAEIGVTETRFPKKNEECFLCGLCVRVCQERMQVGAINFVNRGTDRKVSPPYDKYSPICMACGACEVVCPAQCVDLSKVTTRLPRPIPSEFDQGLVARGSIYIPFPQAVPNKPVIDEEHCLRLRAGTCGACEIFCEAQAIAFDQQDTVDEFEVGTIIVATGFQAFDPTPMRYYGYGRYPNVYTALEVERLLNAAGPTEGNVILRDGSVPKRVGIVHCIGSRDSNYHLYCSRVCCMYSLKLAHLVREKTGAEVYNFYIDMRTPGKAFEEFYLRVQNEGVNFIRGKVGEVAMAPASNGQKECLVVTVDDTLEGRIRTIPVDMLVLAVALEPRAGAEAVRRLFNMSCSSEGFFLEKHPKLAPVNTANDAVFVAGACQGPKDIPDTVAQADAAAAKALSMIDAGQFELEPNTAWVDEEICSGCKTCIPLCPYKALTRDEQKKVAVVDEALCKGCGTCVAACPSGAAQQHLFTDDQIFEEIEGILAYV